MSAEAIEGEIQKATHDSLSAVKPLILGAAWGIAMWSSYALIEYLLYSACRLFLRPGAVFTPVNWHSNTLLFDVYWVLGAVTGTVGGLVSTFLPKSPGHSGQDPGRDAGRDAGRDPVRMAGAFALFPAIAVNLAFGYPLGPSPAAVFAIASAWAGATGIALLRPESTMWRWVQINPLLFACLILGPPWISAEMGELAGPAAMRISFALAVLAFGGLHYLTRRWPDWGAGRHLAANLLLLTILICVCSMVSSARHALPQDIKTMGTPDPAASPVIMVSFDTTRADHMSVYGYPQPTTPYLTEFAKGATLYTAAVAAADMTLPSHASIFTGMYGSWHGAHVFSAYPTVIHALDAHLPTLAWILSQKGYRTAAVAANNAFLLPQWGLTRGFGGFIVEHPVQMLLSDRRGNLRQGIRLLLDKFADTTDFDAMYRSSDDVTEDAIRLMEGKAGPGQPFFLFLNYMDAHSPYIARAPRGMGLTAGEHVTLARMRDLERELITRKQAVPAGEMAGLVAHYDAGIAMEDASFQRLMEWLKRNGVYEKALIVVVGDHGEAFGEHGLMEHGVSVYQDQVHIPLIVKYPNQTSPSVVSVPVSHVDLMPTILDMLGYPIPAHVQGRSMRDPKRLENRDVISESFPRLAFLPYRGDQERSERSIRRGSMKMIISTRGKRELYDLSKDAPESGNLIGAEAAVAQAMEARLREWVRLAPADMAKPVSGKPADLKRLKGLGYIQ